MGLFVSLVIIAMDTEPAFHPTPLPSGGRRPVITSPHCRCGNLRPRHYPSHLGGGISPRSHYELALQNRSIMDLDFPVRLFVCSLLRRNRGVASNATPKPHQTSSTYLQPAEYELVSVATRGHGASGPSGANGLCTCNCHLRLRSPPSPERDGRQTGNTGSVPQARRKRHPPTQTLI